ncbi:hypothetical protein TNCV_2872611 [Trichonephila clavipes]|nr:hypothetical protein TNCV_2872611 [Trichonephila clavipes]
MSEDQVNAIKTPAARMKTVSEDRVQLCGHNKNISFLNEDGFSRHGRYPDPLGRYLVQFVSNFLQDGG